METLLFSIQGDRFGVDLADVDEILMMASLQPLTGCPDFLAGVLNLRSQIVPVLDLTRRLGGQRPTPEHGGDGRRLSPYQRNTRMLLVTVQGQRIALIIDGVEAVSDLSQHEMKEHVVQEEGRPDYMDRFAVYDGAIVQLIRVKNVLREEEIGLLRKDPTVAGRLEPMNPC